MLRITESPMATCRDGRVRPDGVTRKKVDEDRTRAAGHGRVHGLRYGYALERSYVLDDLLGKRPPVMQRWTDAIAE